MRKGDDGMENKYFNLKSFEEEAESNGFPPHEDIANFLNQFSGTKPIFEKKCIRTETHKASIENYCCVLENLKDFQDDDHVEFDIGVVLVSVEEALWNREDVDENGEVSRLRLVPFAYTGYEEYFCFYFEKETARPQIVLWYKEESWEYTPVFDVIAENIDVFVEMLVGADGEEEKENEGVS